MTNYLVIVRRSQTKFEATMHHSWCKRGLAAALETIVSKATDTQVAIFTRRNTELARMFLAGERDQEYVLQALQEITEGKFVLADRFGRYANKLLPLWQQLNIIKQFNILHWDNVLTDEQLAAVDTSSDHAQSVDDLEILYVDFGSPEKNVEAWWKVLVGTQPNAWRWDGLKTDRKKLRLDPNAKSYEPGIHRVRINLVSHWEPKDGRAVDEVRPQAKAAGEILAHAEAMAAYGLHAELLQEQDGENLPYVDLAGFQATVSGIGAWTDVPCLDWNRDDREVQLYADWSDGRNQSWAAPVVRES